MTFLIAALLLAIAAHELGVFRRGRRASQTLTQNKTWPARLERRATDQHR